MEVLSLVLTVIGFGVTIWQLVRTANATEAAAKTLRETAKRMSANYLLVLAPQVRIFETDLDHACDTDDAGLARRTLVGYGQMANQVAALIAHDGANTDKEALSKKLRRSAKAASDAKMRLLEVKGTPGEVAVLVKEVLRQMGEVSNDIANLIPRLQMEV